MKRILAGLLVIGLVAVIMGAPTSAFAGGRFWTGFAVGGVTGLILGLCPARCRVRAGAGLCGSAARVLPAGARLCASTCLCPGSVGLDRLPVGLAAGVLGLLTPIGE